MRPSAILDGQFREAILRQGSAAGDWMQPGRRQRFDLSQKVPYFGLDRCGTGRHVAPNHRESQVFNNPHVNNPQIQLVPSLRLTYLSPPHTVPSILMFSVEARTRDEAISNSAPMCGDAVWLHRCDLCSALIPNNAVSTHGPMWLIFSSI